MLDNKKKEEERKEKIVFECTRKDVRIPSMDNEKDNIQALIQNLTPERLSALEKTVKILSALQKMVKRLSALEKLDNIQALIQNHLKIVDEFIQAPIQNLTPERLSALEKTVERLSGLEKMVKNKKKEEERKEKIVFECTRKDVRIPSMDNEKKEIVKDYIFEFIRNLTPNRLSALQKMVKRLSDLEKNEKNVDESIQALIQNPTPERLSDLEKKVKRLSALQKMIDRVKTSKSETLETEQIKPHKEEVWTLSKLKEDLDKQSVQSVASGGTLDFLIQHGLVYPIPKINCPEHTVLYAGPLLKWIERDWNVTPKLEFPDNLSPPNSLIPIMEDVLKEIRAENNKKYNKNYYKAAMIIHYLLGFLAEESPGCNIKELTVKYKIKQSSLENWELNGFEIECTIEFERPVKKEVLVTLKNFLESVFKHYIYVSAGKYYEEQADSAKANKNTDRAVKKSDYFETRVKEQATYSMSPDPEKDDISSQTRFTAKLSLDPIKIDGV